jgi:LCP family protein required for cell wall assembly
MSQPELKKHTALFVVTLIFLSLVSLFLGVLGFGYYKFKHYYNLMNHQENTDIYDTILPEPDETDSSGAIIPPETDISDESKDKIHGGIDDNVNTGTPIVFNDNVLNILLIGTDGRSSSDRGRSDSIIVITINQETKKISFTSIMRDIYVQIPGKGYNKINAAYAYGGASLLMQTIENNFHLSIDKYVSVNFSGFSKIIDILGGLSFPVTEKEITYLNRYIGELNSLSGIDSDTGKLAATDAGTHTMSGIQTLAYCRIRYTPYVMEDGTLLDADFGRTYRQRMVLSLLSEKAKTMSISQLDEILESILPLVTTNLTEGECLNLISKVTSYISYEIGNYSLPVNGSWQYATIDGMSVLSVDFEKNTNALQKIIEGTY